MGTLYNTAMGTMYNTAFGMLLLSNFRGTNCQLIRKHGIDFADVADMFNHPMLTRLDDREDYSELRWVSMGVLKTMIGMVVHTERTGNIVRIISARKATKREVKYYERHVTN